ncbi:MAG: nucleotide exchange factor GrpE [Gammaproteobacteria bacterium]|jgi:molecular chaperone GrpE|nr:nucleotide exchange factor GrpE [Gammaproteobacteria bacterium]MDP6615722.1 nucleotide exchange factor GrpE [Gammaproteobacteria bacterium]MDP6695267.1 nucleotide exchange factor GrpE [Gammaproteobacteria bacterium]
MSGKQDKPEEEQPDDIDNDPATPDNDPEGLIETTVLPEDAAVRDDDEAQRRISPEEALERAEAAAEENWNKYLRAVAELDNVRKRAIRDVENARRYGAEGLAAELLTVADSLEMGLEAADNDGATVESLLEGKQATLKLLQVAMEKTGITAISPEGEPFDPEMHEAMSMQESDTAEPNTVIIVVQRGYQLNGRLLRPARVIVAREPAGD